MKRKLEVLTMGEFKAGEKLDRFEKDILRPGTWVHPVTRKMISFDQDRLTKLVDQTNKYLKNENKVPFPDGHSTAAKDNMGWWLETRLDEQGRLMAVLNTSDQDVAAKLKNGTIDSVSACIEFGLTDSRGNFYPEVITHICGTNYPVIEKQGEFVALSRDAGGAQDDVEIYVDPEQLGDLPGHEFRGNQYTESQGQSDAIRKHADLAKKANDASHEAIRGNVSHEVAAAANRELAKAHEAEAKRTSDAEWRRVQEQRAAQAHQSAKFHDSKSTKDKAISTMQSHLGDYERGFNRVADQINSDERSSAQEAFKEIKAVLKGSGSPGEARDRIKAEAKKAHAALEKAQKDWNSLLTGTGEKFRKKQDEIGTALHRARGRASAYNLGDLSVTNLSTDQPEADRLQLGMGVKDEALWSKAKAQAEKEGHGDDYAYITGIYKKMGGEFDHMMSTVSNSATGNPDGGVTMDLSKLALLLGLPKDTKPEIILAAAEKAQEEAKANAMIATQLAALGFKVEDGKVVKLDAAPKTDREKELEATLEESRLQNAKSQLSLARSKAEAIVKSGKLPAAMQARLERVLAVAGRTEAVALSTNDPRKVTNVAIDVAKEVGELFDAVPSILKERLATLPSLSPADVEAAKKQTEQLATRSKDIASRNQPKEYAGK